MKITAIILSAGTGSRMNSQIKKQYMLICGKPVIWHTLKAFQESSVDEIVLVTGKSEIEYCRQLVNEAGFTKVSQIVSGGKERYHSVYEGLLVANGSDYVLVHDGARPLIGRKIIEDSINEVQKREACVVAVKVKDTIKRVDSNGVVADTPDRNELWAVQTPQIFSYNLLREAYDKMMRDSCMGITDDAMVVEKYSKQSVYVIEGEYTNIKITTPEDLDTAENFLKKVKKSVDTQND